MNAFALLDDSDDESPKVVSKTTTTTKAPSKPKPKFKFKSKCCTCQKRQSHWRKWWRW